MRRQGFSGAAVPPFRELGCSGMVEILEELDHRFTVREKAVPIAHAAV